METGLPLVPFPMVPAYPANMSMASYPPYQTSFPPTTSVSTLNFPSTTPNSTFQFAHMPSVALPGNMADFAAQVSDQVIFISYYTHHITQSAFIITGSMQLYLSHWKKNQGKKKGGTLRTSEIYSLCKGSLRITVITAVRKRKDKEIVFEKANALSFVNFRLSYTFTLNYLLKTPRSLTHPVLCVPCTTWRCNRTL